MDWSHIWNRLRSVPTGIWAALGVALTILGLYLRGKRLQGELAKARVDAEAAKAAAVGAKNLGKAAVHLNAAEAHSQKAADIQKNIAKTEALGAAEQKRIHTLPASAVTDEYLKMLRDKKP